MSDVAIKVEGLGKKYKIGRQKSGNLRESLANLFKKDISTPHINDPSRQRRDSTNKQFNSSTIHPTNNEFWALRDINFEVKQGEAVGIIGRNGAGKSTLLKILSRITKPTTGRFEINGRVSSLLEVGTGFHMELTGRENIYLNGTILGMKRREIKAKFDEILAFSGVEEFIDTPVKHYSSGMKVRLAFSVAAHLDPEILIIDEVLAVGDADFQKKCLGKMEDVAGQGRTVLFVSHNIGAVKKLCNRIVYLKDGRINRDSRKVESVVGEYLVGESFLNSTLKWDNSDPSNNEYFKIDSFSIYNTTGNLCKNAINRVEDCLIIISGAVLKNDPSLEIGYQLYTINGEIIYTSYFYDAYSDSSFLLKKEFLLKSKLPLEYLNEGEYILELIGGLRNRRWFYGPTEKSVQLRFELIGNLSISPLWSTKRKGVLAPVIHWVNDLSFHRNLK